MSDQSILCLVFIICGAFSDLVVTGSKKGNWKEERMMSCLESTLGLVLEQMTSRITSWEMAGEPFFWRITSIEEEVFPIKWWYVGWGIMEEEKESLSQKNLKSASLLFFDLRLKEAFASPRTKTVAVGCFSSSLSIVASRRDIS